jgi:hypothetical protein
MVNITMQKALWHEPHIRTCAALPRLMMNRSTLAWTSSTARMPLLIRSISVGPAAKWPLKELHQRLADPDADRVEAPRHLSGATVRAPGHEIMTP